MYSTSDLKLKRANCQNADVESGGASIVDEHSMEPTTPSKILVRTLQYAQLDSPASIMSSTDINRLIIF